MTTKNVSLKERAARLLAKNAASEQPTPERKGFRVADMLADLNAGKGLSRAKLLASLPTPVRALGAPLAPLEPDQEAIVDGLLGVLGPCPEDGRRGDAALAVGGVLKSLGLSKPRAEVIVPHLFQRWMTESEREQTEGEHTRRALTAWATNGPVSGLGALRDAFGSRADAIMAVADAVVHARRHAANADKREVTEEPTAESGGSYTGGPTPLPTDAALLGTVLSFRDPEQPIEYICPALGIAPNDGKVTMIAGLFGGAKGPFADYLAVCFALGAKVFGEHDVTRTNALILDFESSRLTMKRCRRMAQGLGRDPGELDGALHVMAASAAAVMDPSWLVTLAAYIETHQIGVVVVDSYTRALLAHGVDFDRPEFAELAAELASLKCCVIVIAHANKASATKDEPTLLDVSGSATLPSQVQTGIILYYPNRQDKNVVRVKCDRALEAPFVAFDATWSGDKDEPLKLSAGATPARGRPTKAGAAAEDSLATNVQKIVDAVKRAAPGELTTRALRTESTLDGRAWPPAIKAAIASKRVHSRPDGKGNAILYSLGNPEPSNPAMARFRQSVERK